jgi:hypothetical protein
MAITRIDPDNIERYTLLANPRRTFSSASSTAPSTVNLGISGTLPLFSDGSSVMKDVYSDVGIDSNPVDDSQIENLRSEVIKKASDSSNFYGSVNLYLDGINSIQSSSMFAKKQSVVRFESGVKIESDFQRKRVVKEMLFPYYRNQYPSLQYSYTNYHSLNFVTCSYLATGSALIYPAGTGTVALEDTNFYAPSSSFTFDFYVNPRYSEERVGDEFKAGTILHMSSSYAISLVTGTSTGLDGKKDGFRLLLQLSQSAEIPPSSISISGDTVSAPGVSSDTGFLFVTPDNTLAKNNWHHVSVRWGGSNVQNGTGSFVIDGKVSSEFVITSASVMEPVYPSNTSQFDSDALFVGNFFEGRNTGDQQIAGFFNTDSSLEFGTISIPAVGDADPSNYYLRHPLNAEIHDLKIFDNYRTLDQIFTSSIKGFSYNPYEVRTSVTGTNHYLSGTSASEGLLFYVPPFFTKKSPKRYVNQTPFFYATGSSDDPFNVAMSFSVGGHELNLPNFTREFVRGFYPRPIGLEASRVEGTTSTAQKANYLIYESGSNRKRNLTVLPCDNGKFTPNFQMLLTESLQTAAQGSALDRFRNDFGILDLSRIDLNNLVSTASLPGVNDPATVLSGDSSGSILSPILGATPEDPSVSPGNILTVLQRTKDPSSNEVVFFDISNMFYGDQLKPGSIVLKDMSVTGSNGRVVMTLKDDGLGNLYRADSKTKHATWASVGNVIYEEGIVVVKSPNIPLFGSDAWELSFEGQRNIHVLEISVTADKGLINSSSNPSFKKLIPTDRANEIADEFVYLTGVQLHDNNLNVIGRANLAQPVVKRDGDRFTIKLRMDF